MEMNVEDKMIKWRFSKLIYDKLQGSENVGA